VIVRQYSPAASFPCFSRQYQSASVVVGHPGYGSDVTRAAGEAIASVLACWSAWADLRGAGRNPGIPPVPGLYRIRRANDESVLTYIGQTGRSLRGRLGQLNGVYRAEMPYRDPHTAAPALWALRNADGCDFEASVIEAPGTPPERKALEATAITLYRMESARSPTANFGRMPPGYRISTGNNAQLVARGRRARGGSDPEAPITVDSAPVACGVPEVCLACELQR
jgi:hypothetical protein